MVYMRFRILKKREFCVQIEFAISQDKVILEIHKFSII